ncbi:unnamed protein product [Rangifer tarandus platyrhynchus]|uniref:Uncharacterized protein n=2 Tax=Rangifer tarandus platyrhynchus TaxID=3082113 RepID=A0ABN8ZS55_RANTA|nr:unnamed protein product [Rangifer tarandus platyrhynchus]
MQADSLPLSHQGAHNCELRVRGSCSFASDPLIPKLYELHYFSLSFSSLFVPFNYYYFLFLCNTLPVPLLTALRMLVILTSEGLFPSLPLAPSECPSLSFMW